MALARPRRKVVRLVVEGPRPENIRKDLKDIQDEDTSGP